MSTNASSHPARLLLVDYGLSERTIQGICLGLDQLFSLIKSSVVSASFPLFALLVNGQNQSEVFLPFSSPNESHVELQVALCKLQLLGQKWAMKSNGTSRSSSSWNSPLKLIEKEMKNLPDRRVQLTVFTHRLSESNLNELRRYSFDLRTVEVIVTENNDDGRLSSAFDLVNVRFLRENKYSIGLYFKSWLMNNDGDAEHLQLFIPKKDKNSTVDDALFHLIRCDLQEFFIAPEHEAFYIGQRSVRTPRQMSRLRAIQFLGENRCCVSLIFGRPLLVTSTTSRRYDETLLENNASAFGTLIDYLRDNVRREEKFSLICRMDETAASKPNEQFFGHFLLSLGVGQSLILRSIVSSELLLPLTNIPSENQRKDADLASSLAKIEVENDEFNPLFFEARRNRLNFETNL